MDSFSEIFETMVQDHGRFPRNFGALESPTHQAEGVNPLTGDHFSIQAQIRKDLIEQIGFTSQASALATTSASIMTSRLVGLSREAAHNEITQILKWISGEMEPPENLKEDEFAVLLEIRHFPHRIRCAALPWNTAAKALTGG